MYLDCKVEIPKADGKITKKTIKGTTYIYYEYARVYVKEKKYNTPKRTCIGKQVPGQPLLMIPNDRFLKIFPQAILPEEKSSYRSGCLRIGAYIVLRRIISDYKLDLMLTRILGADAGLFLDLAVYSIITENNAGQYYPDYAFNHPLMTHDMKIYSDSKVSDLLAKTTVEQRIRFLNEWNEKRDHHEKIYISYDSTNKNCQAGDIDMVEIGHPKEDRGKGIFNYSIAYDRTNSEPLYYEAYPGSIVDISQLRYTLEKAKGYGYKRAGFILDRGYFDKENIRFMDANGYDFVIMVKGMKKLVRDVVMQAHGTFEDDRRKSIRSYKVSGTTIRKKLYADDDKGRYIHIYFNDGRKKAEREKLEEKIDQMGKKLEEFIGKSINPGSEYEKYFDLVFRHPEQGDEKLASVIERIDVINRELKLCGYFVIVTSAKMDAEEALTLYKSRDASEKLFRGTKSYLGARSERVYSNESIDTKLFVEFVATILRSKMYILLKEEMNKQGKKQNYMTVPAAIRELEKIELLKGADNEYRLDYAVTATQKAILKAFGMSAADVQKQANEISSELFRIEKEEFEKAALKENGDVCMEESE